MYPQDLRIRASDHDPLRRRMLVECWWSPNTNEVSLVGGPGDGRELVAQDIRMPLVVQCMPDRMAAFRDPGAYTDSDLSASAEPDRVMYRVAGWKHGHAAVADGGGPVTWQLGVSSGRPEVTVHRQPCGDWLVMCSDPPIHLDMSPALTESDAREMFTQLCEWRRDNQGIEGYE